MLHVEENQLRSMSTENITDLVSRFTKELERRRYTQRTEALRQFKEAFHTLRESGIEVECEDKHEGYSIHIYDFDNFNFNF